MDLLLVTLRFVHVVGGILWVGIAVFVPFYLIPAIADVGPDGGKVMAALQRRGIMNVLPLLAVATLISGFWLYWIRSGGLRAAYVATPAGAVFGIGGLVALAAFVVGITITRPSMIRAAAIMQSLPSLSADEREQQVALANRLRTRGAQVSRVIAWLLLVAAACMAIARYL
ncbi:MAG TPA: hypothetical protein VLE53_14405 [Gemmatimonadaceae bacterium]|nr:hypothetical protein [Gemmatimonadaceae bacterium]